MTVTAITATFQRPDAFELCERYLKRQTRQPDQWLVLDGPERMQQKVLKAIEDDRIEGDCICFIEDDDHYRQDWIAKCAFAILEKGYDMFGEGNACYYNVLHRWWSSCGNKRHAALCQTAVHRDMLPAIANCIRSYDWPFFDVRIWQLESNKRLYLPERDKDRHVIGIKGIRSSTGVHGYSGEHKDILPPATHADPSLIKLWNWIGEDALNYARFWALKPALQ